jgi:soluble lytic murein transglycosylase-like protein
MKIDNKITGANTLQNNVKTVETTRISDFSDVLSSVFSSDRTDLESIFAAASKKHGVSLDLLKAVAKTESNFNPSATSRCGAMGVMQLMPETAEGLGVTDAYDAEQNVMGGAKLLSQLLGRYDGQTELALAAYNAGAGNVDKYGGVPPFEETQRYVEIIMNSLNGAAGLAIRTGIITI